MTKKPLLPNPSKNCLLNLELEPRLCASGPSATKPDSHMPLQGWSLPQSAQHLECEQYLLLTEYY